MALGCVKLDWQEELLWATAGVIPGGLLVSTGGRAIRKGELTSTDIAVSAGMSLGSAVAIARWGSPMMKEVAQYMTFRGLINVKKSAETGRLVLAGGPKLVAYTAVAAVPVGIAAAVTLIYESEVNQPLREASGPASRMVWFGPFASGFGTVV